MTNRNLVAGVLFTLIGTCGLWYGRSLPVGDLRSIGSGFLPIVSFAGVLVVGIIKLGLAAVGAGERISIGLHRGFVFVCLGLVAFAFLLPTQGLIVALFALLLGSEFAGTHKKSIGQFVILAAAMIGASIAVFKYALGVPFPVLPTWI